MPSLSHADLAGLCSRAYKDLSGATCEMEFLIHPEGDVFYIAIRGTEASNALQGFNWLDVVRDMRVIPRYNRATGAGHGGFICGGELVAELLEQYGGFTPQSRLVLTGHSLGAALAVLASQILHKAGYQIDEVVLFGCPRIYALFRPKFDYPVTSYRHGSDIVTNVPRWYRQPVELTKIEPNQRRQNWGDHGIDSYADALRRLESNS